jgi:hypothetical protein
MVGATVAVTERFAREINTDGYTPTVIGAVRFAKQLIKRNIDGG